MEKIIVISLPNGLGDAIQTIPALQEINKNNNLIISANSKFINLFKNVFKIKAAYIKHEELLKNSFHTNYTCDTFLDFNGLNSEMLLRKNIKIKEYISHTLFSDENIINGAPCIKVDGKTIESRYFNAIGYKPMPAWVFYYNMAKESKNINLNLFNILDFAFYKRNLRLTKQPIKCIGIAPCGTLKSKLWSIKNYKFIIDYYLSKGWIVNVYLGPDEKKIRKIFSNVNKNVKVYYNLSFNKFAKKMFSDYLFIANDSGPMHIAGALGLPIIGIFNNTLPQCWFPYKLANQKVLGGYYCSTFENTPKSSYWPTIQSVIKNINLILNKS
jgi:ADP-heptose:LPS heptosyltransferase